MYHYSISHYLLQTARVRNFAAHGFTLIELSVVLVIIGLIAGGVIVGQSLIEAARLRATAAQPASFDSAVYVFKNKYGGIPGDLRNPTQFGFPNINTASGVVPGNRRLESSNGAQNASSNVPGYETTHFWYQLSAAQLLEDRLTQPPAGGLGARTAQEVLNYYPKSMMQNQSLFLVNNGVYSDNNSYTNYYSLWKLNGTSPYSTAYSLTPAWAHNIDKKIDDGLPQAGKVRALQRSANLIHRVVEGPFSAPCIATTTTYDLSKTSLVCALQFRVGF